MSEKEHIQNINEEFTDFAWSKMRKTLDKEMPVKDKKDRRLFFWLFFFFSLLAIGIYFYVVNGLSPITEVAPIALDSDSGSRSNNDKNSRANNASVNLNPNQNNTLTATKITDTKTVLTTLAVKKNNPPAATSVVRKNNIPTTAKVIGTEDKNVQATSVAKINNIQAATEVADTKEATSVASINPVIPQSHNPTIPQSPQFPRPHKFSQTYSWMLGTMNSNQASDFGGLTTGLVANYRFNSKIGIETGLNYAWSKKPITFYIVSDSTAINTGSNSDNIETVSDPNIAQSEELDIINQFETNSFHYFRMPIRFTYKPHRKIQLHSGVEFAYLWKTGALINSFAQNDATLFTGTSSMRSSSSFQKFDANLQAGIRYYPIPKLGLGLHYRQGFTDITADKGGHFNSGFQLSALYQFAPR